MQMKPLAPPRVYASPQVQMPRLMRSFSLFQLGARFNQAWTQRCTGSASILARAFPFPAQLHCFGRAAALAARRSRPVSHHFPQTPSPAWLFISCYAKLGKGSAQNLTSLYSFFLFDAVSPRDSTLGLGVPCEPDCSGPDTFPGAQWP